MNGLFLASVLGVLAAGSAANKETHSIPSSLGRRESSIEVTRVPGFQGALASRHWAGYLDVGPAGRRHLHYYFVESEHSPHKDPVVIWVNGGPGCSSYDGFVYELGPFNYKLHEGRVWLTKNPYAWSKVANVLFLDSPVGVGYSYSDDKDDYMVGDRRTAADAHAFLRAWFQKFPSFQQNDFFVAGESYAGIYVPNLVRAVVEGNEAGDKPHINLKGYLVGNGCTDDKFDGDAFPLFSMGKSLISVQLYRDLVTTCEGHFWNASRGSECEKLLGNLEKDLDGLNVYNILDICHEEPQPSLATAAAAAASPPRTLRQRQQHLSKLRQTLPRRWPLAGGVAEGEVVHHLKGLLGEIPPCTNTREADIWLNDPRVRKALHAAPASKIGPWVICSDALTYTHDTGSMVPIHRNLTQRHGLRALIYSGDHDLSVPHTGSEAWTQSLGYKRLHDGAWQPWLDGEGQVAGYATAYANGLTYATVKGAGHMVPQFKPAQALVMFHRFLEGLPLHATETSSRAASSS